MKREIILGTLRIRSNDFSRSGNSATKVATTRRCRDLMILGALAFLVLLLTFSFSSTPTSAQTGGGYDLTWNTVDSGGATFSAGGAYTLGGTIGQADAGALSGGDYSLAGGFWPSGISLLLDVYLPLVVR